MRFLATSLTAACVALAAHAQPALLGVGNTTGSTNSKVFGISYTVDFANNTGSVSLGQMRNIVGPSGQLLQSVNGKEGAAYGNGRLFVSNIQGPNGPRTGTVNLATGRFIPVSNQAATDPNPIPGFGPFTSSTEISNGLADNEALGAIVGITTDAVQWGFSDETGERIGNLAPVPLGFAPAIDTEGLAFDAQTNTAYIVQLNDGPTPMLRIGQNLTNPNISVTDIDLSGIGLEFSSNIGLAWDNANDALILSSVTSLGTDFYAFDLDADVLNDVQFLGSIEGQQIGGLAATAPVPAPGVAALLGLFGASTAARRRR